MDKEGGKLLLGAQAALDVLRPPASPATETHA